MTVRDLIRKLVDCDMNKEVVIDVCIHPEKWDGPKAELRSAKVVAVDGWHENVTVNANLVVDAADLATMGLQRTGGGDTSA